MAQIESARRERDSHIFERQIHDHYVEEQWCDDRLFDVETFEDGIWDPACGFGRIPEAARKRGHRVAYSDIVDRGYDPFNMKVERDFLESNKKIGNIVCNPPFNIFEQFARHALELAAHKVAMIWLFRRLPAARWLVRTPLARVWLMTPRPSMPTGEHITNGGKVGGGTQDFCWLIWEQGHVGRPVMDWLHRDPSAWDRMGPHVVHPARHPARTEERWDEACHPRNTLCRRCCGQYQLCARLHSGLLETRGISDRFPSSVHPAGNFARR